jgi:RNA recognition motif-containing protein
VTIKKKKEISNFFNFRYGFVEFADIRNAEESLVENEKDFMGRNIRVELANKNKKRYNNYE